MKCLKFSLSLCLILLVTCCQEKDQVVVISTPYGDMTAVFFDDTPLHKENFIQLAQEGKYDSVIFHRVIEEFMIQGGNLRTGKFPDEENYTLPAELAAEKHIHKKGAIAAARTGDAVNPEKKSSGTQFYIVQGLTYEDDASLQSRADRRMELKLGGLFTRMLRSERFPELTEKYNFHLEKYRADSTYDFGKAQKKLVFESLPIIEEEFGDQTDPGYPDFAKEIYATIGGIPHLDAEYTVFGQIVEGLDIIDKIAAVETNDRDKPLEDVRMFMEVREMFKSEIIKKYGVEYPKED